MELKWALLLLDENECADLTVCGNYSKCLNTHGSYYCTCKEGFRSQPPNFTATTGQCFDINECLEQDDCGTNANCSNHQGGYSCKCHQGYSNYGNNQSKCIEMSCDHFDSDAEDAPLKLKNLLALLRSNCESLRGPNGGRQTGEQLLENVFTSFDELLSEGNIADGKMLNQFLDVVENSMRLIGPQLKEPLTRMETHNTFAELAVMRGSVGGKLWPVCFYFFFLSAFLIWMLLRGFSSSRMVCWCFHTTLKHLYMYAGGITDVPVIVTISAIAFSKGYGTDRHCWLSLDRYFIWSFFAPVCIIVVLNSFVFVITVWKLAEKFSSLNPDLSKLRNIRGFTVTAVAQMCVLGGMWVFGCFLFQEKGTQVALYLFTILNSLQGALIFIMHCLLSKPVRDEYCKLISRICSLKDKKYSEFSTNQSSNSQQPLRSNQSTGESKI
ncbi:hypothetical protein cypCar_00031832 [Cyprinus carpio]|nr:hypothetical protein cypCar_00031832 [Cyprinus carpio]